MKGEGPTQGTLDSIAFFMKNSNALGTDKTQGEVVADV